PPPSPPRVARRLPGRASRLTTAEREAARKLQEKHEAEARAREAAAAAAASMAVEDVVRSHYNERPEMGKQWRTESSRIKGLRNINNWIKSCVIQKFSPNPAVASREGGVRYAGEVEEKLCVLDVGCGKGGDLLKWKLAPQEVGMYVGVDTAEVSVAQARDRYEAMLRERSGIRGGRRPPSTYPPRLFRAEFAVRDCWVDSLFDVPAVREIGFDPSVGPGNRGAGRWGAGGGFDVVSMMFCLHYAFESEAKARRMLSNVAGALKKGGRFFGTIPSSDVIKRKLEEWVKEETARQQQEKEKEMSKDGEAAANGDAEGGEEAKGKNTTTTDGQEKKPREFSWGNSIYKVTFGEDVLSRILPQSPRFRPPFGWRYIYHLEEAVETVPEYVVPWESFRALCEDYNLELIYKKPFHEVWRQESGGRELGALSERMGVRARGAGLLLSDEEWEACGFYVAFAFRKS
ncbi:S-adenosyl-L-methionine-dependent methyltransferase, partial [Kalaharituber pfeilii]